MQRDKIKNSKTLSKEEFKKFLDQNPRKTYKELVKICPTQITESGISKALKRWNINYQSFYYEKQRQFKQ